MKTRLDLNDHIKVTVGLRDAQSIGINGLDCAGKTTFALDLKQQLEAIGRKTKLFHVDDFNNKGVQQRVYAAHASGEFSNEMFERYYNESVDYSALASAVTAATLPNQTVIVEGVFLYKPVLSHLFDYKVFLECDAGVARSRYAERRVDVVDDRPITIFDDIWLPAFTRYCDEFSPATIADTVIKV